VSNDSAPKHPLESGVVFQETAQVIGVEERSAPLAFFSRAGVSTSSPVGEQFRALGARIEALGEERPFRCIGVVSAVAGEGKTTIALGLASALVRDPGRRILLVEADLRKPSMSGFLGIPKAPGLNEWLESDEPDVGVRKLVPLGFTVLQAGRTSAPHPENVASERMARLLESARRAFDFVIVDCPPIVPVADAVLLQDRLDGFLLVVRSRTSPREAILQSISRLKADRIRGVVFNDHSERLPSYYTYANARYGDYYGDEPR
jgi:capsular exopolysaccharide synthesis family protein